MKRAERPDEDDELPENNEKEKKAKKVHTALPWMRIPAAYPPSAPVGVRDVCGMHAQLAEALVATGHANLFPVQAVAWEVLAGGVSSAHDLCIDAPTGSGKTLAYTLPVLQRCLTQPGRAGIQALVVVPTRVLAKQVFDVFMSLQAHIPNLHIVLANGSESVASELSQLSGTVLSETSRPLSETEPPVATDDHMHDMHEHHNEAERDEQDRLEHLRNGLGSKLVSLPDLLPFDRKLFGHPYRGCRTVSDIIKTVTSEHACCACGSEGLGGATCMACMHDVGMWRWGHLSPQPVNVAVVTPGRLVHHLQELGPEWLANLEMLVVDEADRLLRQAYNEWLPVLNASLAENSKKSAQNSLRQLRGSFDTMHGDYASLERCMPSMKSVVKILVSATLTKDPTKLAKMNLKSPRFISVDRPPVATLGKSPDSLPVASPQQIAEAINPEIEVHDNALASKKKLKKKKKKAADLPLANAEAPAAYPPITSPPTHDDVTHKKIPETKHADQLPPSDLRTTMHEYQVITAAHTKPHALLALLAELKGKDKGFEVRAIVFASAVDAARRLKNLLDGSTSVLGLQVHEMSSRVSSRVQVETLAALQKETSWVLVASDNMTRGMDFPRVHTVINYDLPAHIRTYVHRAGRTARAGASGSVYTILRSEHLGAFGSLMRRGGRKGVLTHKISADAWNGVKDVVQSALEYVQRQEAA